MSVLTIKQAKAVRTTIEACVELGQDYSITLGTGWTAVTVKNEGRRVIIENVQEYGTMRETHGNVESFVQFYYLDRA